MTDALEALMQEGRTFPPPGEFRKTALDTDATVYDDAERDWQGFWAQQALELDWSKEWQTILEWDLPVREVVRRRQAQRRVQLPRPPRRRRPRRPGRVLLGGRAGRHPCGLLPRAPRRDVPRRERAAVVRRREGRPRRDLHGHGARDRRHDAGVRAHRRAALGRVRRIQRAVVARPHQRRARPRCSSPATARGGAARSSRLKDIADEALAETPSIEHVLVLRRTKNDVAMQDGRDVWWHDVVPGQSAECACEEMDSEDLLFLLYTSGTTGKPKGIMHTTGGYLTQCAYTHKHVFDLQPDTDVYWCTADVGWVTGHSYIVYGPLANRTTSVLYEGTPDFPDKDRFWSIVEKYKVTTFYTAPTAIRTFMKWGDEYPERHDLSSLRVMGTVGEPINPEAWVWYYKTIGGERCPVVDTWWQTETGAIMISALPGATTLKPGSATFPLPGIGAGIVDDAGKPVGIPGGGYLVLERPWPSMLRGIWGDPERYRETYWSRFEGKYFAGDGAKRDDEGYFWLLGRVDDIMLVSGHNISTTEVESALVDHPAVAEAAVVGKTDDTTGQAIAAFVTLRAGNEPRDELVEGAPRPRGRADRPDRQAEDDPVHRRAAEDAFGQDHAPAAARRRARTRRSATRPRSPIPTVVDGIKSRYLAAAPDRGLRSGIARTSRNTGPGAPSRSCPGAAVVVDIDGVLSDASSRQHYHRGAAPGLAFVLRLVR